MNDVWAVVGLPSADLLALWVSVKLAIVTTVILLVICTPLAWWLARRQSAGGALLDAVLALPLVLPPSVLGFYLLIALGPQGPGAWLAWGEMRSLAFSFPGLVIASVIYSLPFVLQPLKNSFLYLSQSQLDMAALCGAKPLDRFFTIALPQALPGYVSATVLGIAHTLGEFGVVLMIGGSLEGKTRVASVALYEHVEAGDYTQAHRLAAVLVVISVCLLWLLFRWQRKQTSQGFLRADF